MNQFPEAFGNCFKTDGKPVEKKNLKGEKMSIESDNAKQERRKHTRFRVKNTVFAMIDSHPFGHAAAVLDVSKGGVGLQYCSSETFENNWKRLDVISSYNNFFLRKLPIEIISDEQIDDEQSGLSQEGVKRCGVKFSNLNYTQEALLDIFIKQNATGKK